MFVRFSARQTFESSRDYPQELPILAIFTAHGDAIDNAEIGDITMKRRSTDGNLTYDQYCGRECGRNCGSC